MPEISTAQLRVRSTDMDADGVVNNAVYFQYFEQARLEHLAALQLYQSTPEGAGAGAGAGKGEKSGRFFTIAETRCTYRLPLRYRDSIAVSCWTSGVGDRSFTFAYEIRMRAALHALVAEGSSVQVWLDADARPAPLPPRLKESLQRSAAPAAGAGTEADI